ncbi:hypothetical protein G6713_04980 [Polynucleobacter paneuropaeus]|nr:hypothetical protein G6713_04980 [Polynucleobacter paneuropaeus]
MSIQKFKVIVEVIDTKYFEKIFEFDSDDFYDPEEEIPQNMYESDFDEIMEDIIMQDFSSDPNSWEWNQPAIGNRDGLYIEQVVLIQASSTGSNN